MQRAVRSSFVGGPKCIAAGREEKELGFSSGPRSPFFIQHALESGPLIWLDGQNQCGEGSSPAHGLDARPRPRLWPGRTTFSPTVAMRASWTKRGWAASECGWARAPLPRPGRMGRSVVGLNGRPSHLVSHIFPAIIFLIPGIRKARI
jgi:hypothetical protein